METHLRRFNIPVYEICQQLDTPPKKFEHEIQIYHFMSSYEQNGAEESIASLVHSFLTNSNSEALEQLFESGSENTTFVCKK